MSSNIVDAQIVYFFAQGAVITADGASDAQFDPETTSFTGISIPSIKLYKRAVASDVQGVRVGSQFDGKSFPKTRCCVTGNFPRTSVRYSFPS